MVLGTPAFAEKEGRDARSRPATKKKKLRTRLSISGHKTIAVGPLSVAAARHGHLGSRCARSSRSCRACMRMRAPILFLLHPTNASRSQRTRCHSCISCNTAPSSRRHHHLMRETGQALWIDRAWIIMRQHTSRVVSRCVSACLTMNQTKHVDDMTRKNEGDKTWTGRSKARQGRRGSKREGNEPRVTHCTRAGYI